MKVGAVIVTYENAATLSDCVQSLLDAGVQEIVVVDNASRDGVAAVAARLPVRFVVNETNLGFGSACNRGASLVVAPHLLFLNPDAVLAAGALASVEQWLVTHPSVGVVGLQLVSPDGTMEAGSFGASVSLLSLGLRHMQWERERRGPWLCGWVSAGAMLIRREAWQAVGGFDPGFFLYWEDVDVCRRMRDAGWQVAHHPQARVRHQRGVSLADPVRKTVLYDAGADRYFRKHYATTIWQTQRWLRRQYRRWWRLVR